LGDPLYVVFNPMSGKGRGARLVQPVLSGLSGGGTLEHGLTTGIGDEVRLVRDALARGFRTIVAVGGDGTWGNVANAILKSGVKGVNLGIVPAGTGCDLAKSLGVPPKDVAACCAIIRGDHIRVIDVGRIEDRYFLNVAGFGFDIAVLEDSWSVSYLRGDLLYLYCALRQISRFPGFVVEMNADGEEKGQGELLMLTIANGKVFGGGFQIAPKADLHDGLLNAFSFGNVSLLRRLRLMGRLLKGTHEGAPGVTATTAGRFRLRFQGPPAYETDGEWNRARTSEVDVESVPSALAVLAPQPS
jgi:diacylglycerol kinase (ATP)